MISKIINVVIAIYIGLAMTSIINPSWADQIEPANYQIDGAKASNIARQYLNSIGFSRAGTSVYSASVGKAILLEDTWVVKVSTGKGTRLPVKRGIVLVNATNGQVKQNL